MALNRYGAIRGMCLDYLDEAHLAMLDEVIAFAEAQRQEAIARWQAERDAGVEYLNQWALLVKRPADAGA